MPLSVEPPAPPPDPEPSRRELWRIRDYRWFLISLGASTLASQVLGAAVAYQIYAITRDPFSLGLIGLAEALPFIACVLPAGHFADVLDRKRMGLVALMVMAGAAVGLWGVSHGADRLGQPVVKAAAYGLVAATGICRAVFQPARGALAAEIVPRSLYPLAVSLRTGVWQMAAVTGPALGGATYAAFGAETAYGVAAVLMGASIVTWRRIDYRRPPAGQGSPRVAMWASLREGFVFLWHEPLIFPAIALDLFAVLFGGAAALLPIFAEEILRVGPGGFGLLRSAPAAGAVAMSVALVFRRPFTHAGRSMLIAVAVFGVCTIGFALSRSFALSLGLLAGAGAADMISIVVRGTLMQVRVPTQMLGRLSAINQIFIGSSNEIGAFESGLAAKILGTVPSVVAGGTATLLVVALTAWRAPALRRLGPLR
jgi:MFS family permease